MAMDKFVRIDDSIKYGIPPGARDEKGARLYLVSTYHQLNCLVWLSQQVRRHGEYWLTVSTRECFEP